MMMSGKCSHCGCNGRHNSRTCIGNGGLKLFGVQLNMSSHPSSPSSSSPVASTSSASSHVFITETKTKNKTKTNKVSAANRYSNGLIMSTSTTERRKKGIPWSEEEHGRFLVGLEKLGKGDWRGISRSFVSTRTPTQVASHAQKYFLRQSNIRQKKRQIQTNIGKSCSEIESLGKASCFLTCEDVVGKAETGMMNRDGHGEELVPKSLLPASFGCPNMTESTDQDLVKPAVTVTIPSPDLEPKIDLLDYTRDTISTR